MAIGTDLGNTVDTGWVVSGWAMASAVSSCIAGSMSDIFGRRHIILIGNVVCIVGSVRLPFSSRSRHNSVENRL